MSWIEIVLITIGMSLDTFAAVECQGALVAKLEKKRLSMAVTVIALWQTIALLIGSFLVTLLNQYDTQLSGEAFIGRILAILILFGMGLRMFVKAWRNERIVEKREDGLDIKKTFFSIAKGTIFTILTGIAFAFLEADIKAVLIMMSIVSMLGMSSCENRLDSPSQWSSSGSIRATGWDLSRSPKPISEAGHF